MPRARSTMDVAGASNTDSLPISEPEPQRSENSQTAREPDVEQNATSVQRPVDLYKAIFSDDSDDDVDNASLRRQDVSTKKTDGANMTLNRLVAGDFLESLGKELGLEVPMDAPRPLEKNENLVSTSGNFDSGDTKPSMKNGHYSSIIETPNTFLEVNIPTSYKSSSPDF